MSSQLEQLLSYLERDGVTEVLFGSGRPIAMRKGGTVTNITARPLSADQLSNMLRGSEISALVPDSDGEGRVAAITVGKRRAMVQVARRGHEIVVSLTRVDATTATAATPAAQTLPIARVAGPGDAPRAKTPTRGKTPTSAPRTKAATSSPRTKAPTRSPTRAKAISEPPRSKPSTAGRVKGATSAPRTKTPTAAPRKKGATSAPKPRTTTATRPTGPLVAPARPTPQIPPLGVDRSAPNPSIPPAAAFDFSLDDGVELGAPVTPPAAPMPIVHSDGAISLGALENANFELDLAPPQSFDVDFATSPPQPHARSAPPSTPPGSFDVDFSTSPPQPFAAPAAAPARSTQPQGFARPNQEAFARPTQETFARPQSNEAFAKPRTEEFAKPRTEEFAKPRTEEFAKPRSEEFAKPRSDGFMKINTGGFAKPQPVGVPAAIPAAPIPAAPSPPVKPSSGSDPFAKTAPFGNPAIQEAMGGTPAVRSPAFGPGSTPPADRTIPMGRGAGPAAADTMPFGNAADTIPFGDAKARPLERAPTAQLDLDDDAPQEIAHAGTAPIQMVRGELPPAGGARVHNPAFSALVQAARELGATDLHIAAARVTSVRVNGELIPVEEHANPLSAQGAEELLLTLLEPHEQATLHKAGYVDVAIDAPGGGRLRANISRQQQGLKGTFRLALAAPATLEQLGLPAELAKVVSHHQGLVVIAGPSGHGKTTTLAAFVDLLNSTKPYHILTIEDPVEIVHPRKHAVISQREAGRHTQSFARGLKASLREDPDVIVIGELRDRESVEIALTAAETGHLVIATMSTPSAAKTIDRLIDMFPPEEHSQVRASVAGALRAIVAQRLLPKRGGGIVPAIELVTGVLPLAVLIRDDKLFQLPNLMQRGRAFGMIRFDESLAEHVRAGRIDEATALAVAESKKELAAVLRPAAATTPAAAKTSPLWGFGKKENR